MAEAFIAAAAGRLPVVVQVGHNSLEEARELAAHAEAAGADATSAMPPSYFKPSTLDTLVDCCSQIAEAAASIPFYYYHIPVLTGVAMPMVAFLEQAAPRIPNLAGLKYTANTLHEYQACVAFDGGRFDVLYGFDELLLPALAVGARGAVGSTFNIAAPLYRRLIDAFEAGELGAAREAQLFAVDMINAIARHPFHPAMKLILEWLGTPCGNCRLPLPQLDEAAGAFVGVVAGAGVMFALPVLTEVQGYLYPAVGITTCFLTGLLASVAIDLIAVRGEPDRNLDGLTVFSRSGREVGDRSG